MTGEPTFALALLADPPALRAHRAFLKIQPDALLRELWCLEAHHHLERLAKKAGINILLMGGQGATLRLEPLKQRGSADNDYLTTAAATELPALVADLIRVLRALSCRGAELIRARHLRGPEDSIPLPLRSWVIEVPDLYAGGQKTLEIKLEFHLEPVLPTSEQFPAHSAAANETIEVRTPTRAYQIAFKLMTFAMQPIGIPTGRHASLPRQAYDIDHLAAQLTENDLANLSAAVQERWTRETAQRGSVVPLVEGLRSIADNALLWARACGESTSARWRYIDIFQSGQLLGGAPLTPRLWMGRLGRVGVLALLSSPEASVQTWPGLVAYAAQLPERVSLRAADNVESQPDFWLRAAALRDPATLL